MLPRRFGVLQSDELRRLNRNSRLSVREIVWKAQMSYSKVLAHLRRHGIRIRIGDLVVCQNSAGRHCRCVNVTRSPPKRDLWCDCPTQPCRSWLRIRRLIDSFLPLHFGVASGLRPQSCRHGRLPPKPMSDCGKMQRCLWSGCLYVCGTPRSTRNSPECDRGRQAASRKQ